MQFTNVEVHWRVLQKECKSFEEGLLLIIYLYKPRYVSCNETTIVYVVQSMPVIIWVNSQFVLFPLFYACYLIYKFLTDSQLEDCFQGNVPKILVNLCFNVLIKIN